MKTMILATLAIISLGVGAAHAQSFSHGGPPHQTSGQSNWLAGGDG